MSKVKKTLTDKAFHGIIQKNHKVFEVSSVEDYPKIGAEVTSWFKDYNVTFTSMNQRLFVYNNHGLVWIYDVQIEKQPEEPKESLWSNFFGLWSK